MKSNLKKFEKDSDGAVSFEVTTENCMADATVLDQIIANFIADDVDLMVGVATPVAMAMQAATEDNEIPVVFAAVSELFCECEVDYEQNRLMGFACPFR